MAATMTETARNKERRDRPWQFCPSDKLGEAGRGLTRLGKRLGKEAFGFSGCEDTGEKEALAVEGSLVVRFAGKDGNRRGTSSSRAGEDWRVAVKEG
jgi:hypothetical protein